MNIKSRRKPGQGFTLHRPFVLMLDELKYASEHMKTRELKESEVWEKKVKSGL